MTRTELRRIGSRGAALAILIVAVALVWAGLVGPVVSAWQEKTEEVDRTTELIAHLRRTAAEAPEVKRALEALGQGRAGNNDTLVLENPNLAGASLQAELKRLAEGAGTELRSVQQLPVAKQETATSISVRADLEGDTAQLSHLLYDIEAHEPVFLVRSLVVRGSEQQSTDPNQGAPLLNVQIEVTALIGPSG